MGLFRPDIGRRSDLYLGHLALIGPFMALTGLGLALIGLRPIYIGKSLYWA